MLHHIATSHEPHARNTFRSAPPPSRQVCAECQRGGASLPLYPMNGQRYCEQCLQAWSLSLPEVRADLLAWSASEQKV